MNHFTVNVTWFRRGNESNLLTGWLQLAYIAEQSLAVSFPNKNGVEAGDQNTQRNVFEKDKQKIS